VRTRLAGERVTAFLFGGEAPGVVWRPPPYDLELFVVGPTQELVNDVMTRLIDAKKER
jgi:hypothetical protein